MTFSMAAQNFSDRQRRYWAFQPVVKPPVPVASPGNKVSNPIDAFILAKLKTKDETRKIAPNPEADKVTLIRRATLDLTGLPPSLEEVQAFLADNTAEAFERVVDRLLSSPRYGERWGRHWLDLARYSDSSGFKEDEERPNNWRYRDYVIQSFNEDKPYDRFVREQIAGDELYPNDINARIATGFNRQFPEESGAQVVQAARQDILNDITDTTGAVFLGLTYSCARCHDHKFDPIPQRDYYRLQAFFANVRTDDHTLLLPEPERREIERRYADWQVKTKDVRAKMDKLVQSYREERLKAALERVSPEVREIYRMAPEKRNPYQRLMYLMAKPQLDVDATAFAGKLKGEEAKEFAELTAELKSYERLRPVEPPMAQTISDLNAEAPKTFILSVGRWDVPGEEVAPGFPSILDATPASIVPPVGLNSTGRRSSLANWLADSRNPLTARVMVNRIWYYHFGRGIIGSPSDFGVMGERPTNQPLLDYLAATFVENGWSVKKLNRLIMLSAVYRESSAFRAAAAEVDPDNKLLWRYDRHRLEGEVIRDAMLFVSGNLNLKMGGPGVHPPLPDGTNIPLGGWQVEKDSEVNRRSVYVFVKRNLIYPLFQAFDEPNAQETCARRFRTVIPAQSLELMNDGLVQGWAQDLAARILNDRGLTKDQQIERAYLLVFSRLPSADERRAILEFLDRQSAEAAEGPPPNDKAWQAALADLCHVLLNSNEFLYVN